MTESKRGGVLTKEEHIQILEAQLLGIQEDVVGVALVMDMKDALMEEKEEIANMLAELKSN
ncbi:hypothetical protein HY502_00190 [Candidatus Woesebacteria bacterium]|nr:hypothetical protein [Candidatus Woesebacteria bacterium]